MEQNNTGVSPENLKKLKDPFPVKWRVQTSDSNKALCVAYIDARGVQNRLDEVCGMENWKSTTKVEKGNLYTTILVRVGGEWIEKTDVGTESKIEKEKGEMSDSLKRAAVQWGVGRFLYDLDIQKLPTAKYTNGKFYPAKHDKKTILWSGADLTIYLNGITNLKPVENNTAILKEYSEYVCKTLHLFDTEQELTDVYNEVRSLKKDAAFLKGLKDQVSKIRMPND
jgi:hypothetical protein